MVAAGGGVDGAGPGVFALTVDPDLDAMGARREWHAHFAHRDTVGFQALGRDGVLLGGAVDRHGDAHGSALAFDGLGGAHVHGTVVLGRRRGLGGIEPGAVRAEREDELRCFRGRIAEAQVRGQQHGGAEHNGEHRGRQTCGPEPRCSGWRLVIAFEQPRGGGRRQVRAQRVEVDERHAARVGAIRAELRLARAGEARGEKDVTLAAMGFAGGAADDEDGPRPLGDDALEHLGLDPARAGNRAHGVAGQAALPRRLVEEFPAAVVLRADEGEGGFFAEGEGGSDEGLEFARDALAVDRDIFSQYITRTLEGHPNIRILHEEIAEIPTDCFCIIATGPLTSDKLSQAIRAATKSQHLYFYDAISPIVEGETIDYGIAFRAARYGKGGDDYVNCPMNREEYDRFYDALLVAETVKPHEGMEDEAKFFEGCLPIEELARRGRDTLRYGPMKPVGLTDPRTGREPYACVQLRLENLMADAYNIVGFQCHLKYGEQKRVLQLIPGLEAAEFIRFGQMHRNTYICSPRLLRETLQMRMHPRVLFAGQISGIEGYTEAMATGMIAGMNAARLAQGREPAAPPRASAVGSLAFYLANADAANFQPANTTFALLPPLEPEVRKIARRKADRHRIQVDRGLTAFTEWLAQIGEAAQAAGAGAD